MPLSNVNLKHFLVFCVTLGVFSAQIRAIEPTQHVIKYIIEDTAILLDDDSALLLVDLESYPIDQRTDLMDVWEEGVGEKIDEWKVNQTVTLIESQKPSDLIKEKLTLVNHENQKTLEVYKIPKIEYTQIVQLGLQDNKGYIVELANGDQHELIDAEDLKDFTDEEMKIFLQVIQDVPFKNGDVIALVNFDFQDFDGYNSKYELVFDCTSSMMLFSDVSGTRVVTQENDYVNDDDDRCLGDDRSELQKRDNVF